MKKIVVNLIFFVLVLLSCSDDDVNSNNCDSETLVSAEQYENAPSGQIFIYSLEINDHCLKINVGYSGCSELSLELIDSEAVLESNPPQRNLRLPFNDDIITCQGFFTEELTFDISNLQVKGENKLQLNITNSGHTIFDDTILYEY